MKKNIIFVNGKPGAGKSTRLSNFLEIHGDNYTVLSCGDLIRHEIENKSEVGQIAKSYLENGQLVPDYIVINLLLAGIRNSKKSIIIDGFPRTIHQAEAFFEAEIPINKSIYLDISDELAEKRVLGRICCVVGVMKEKPYLLLNF